jgi:hypothetical protein
LRVINKIMKRNSEFEIAGDYYIICNVTTCF